MADLVEIVATALYECDGGMASEFCKEETTTRPAYYALARAAITAISQHTGLVAENGWQEIETAPKDGSYIVALYCSLDGYAAHLHGRAFVVRHEGKTASDCDLGWALFPGFGGVPDMCLSHWMPLPEPPRASLESDNG